MPTARPVPIAPQSPKILIFDSHPIQYRSPVFRSLRELTSLKVYLFNETFLGERWWHREVNQLPAQPWGLPLREGFPSEIVGTASLGVMGIFRRFRELLKSEQPTAVVIYGYFSLENWVLRWWCRRLRIPLLFIGETFSDDSRGIKHAIKAAFLRWFFHGVTGFVGTGEKNLNFYRARGIAESRLTSAKYCVDTSFFSLDAEEGRRLREQWRNAQGIPADAKVLLFLGRLVTRKRPFDLLALHRKLADPRVYTCFVGNGLLEAELVAKAEGETHIKFLGFQDQQATKGCYYGADLLIVPSEFETWGLVVNEAFACGLPAVVTTTCGSANDLVVPNETGDIFTVGDVEGAAKIVERMLADPAKLAAMGSRAHAKVESEYSVSQFAEAIFKAAAGATSK